ncbi:chaperone modulator CbpM [Dyadobacter jiangsuensis]|uniref:MerR-like DNA binding protein n=1 Tax=Dyadobacter jiangsuensis TaxID=1591085 RepID=A0A2P8G9B3_9BACT|nr:chaperone modulator CbpM [Dyadobacter jiangsuensis]PSL30571.1 MerR-like DNA binding protein [Dyadobacter jiangsuensis]
MENDQLIAVEVFCSHYDVEYTFVESLQEHDLIETVIVGNVRFLQIPQLNRIERIIRLHHELDINLEGIEAIQGLLSRIELLDREVASLRNRLRFYEPGL